MGVRMYGYSYTRSLPWVIPLQHKRSTMQPWSHGVTTRLPGCYVIVESQEVMLSEDPTMESESSHG